MGNMNDQGKTVRNCTTRRIKHIIYRSFVENITMYEIISNRRSIAMDKKLGIRRLDSVWNESVSKINEVIKQQLTQTETIVEVDLSPKEKTRTTTKKLNPRYPCYSLYHWILGRKLADSANRKMLHTSMFLALIGKREAAAK